MLRPIWDAFSSKKYAEKAFCKRNSPNQGTYMGLVIAHRRNNAPQPPKRASGNERPLKQGGGGHPPATLCIRAFSRESLDPRPGPGGNPRRRYSPALVQTSPTQRAHKNTPRLAPGGGLSYIIDGTRAAGSGLPLTQTRPVPGPCREPSPLQCSGGCCASTYGAPPQRGCPGSPAGRARR